MHDIKQSFYYRFAAYVALSVFGALSLVLSMVAVLSNHASAQTNCAKLVNPFIGTGGHGHTFPGVVAPFGMVQLSPDTRLEGWDGCSGYHYSDSIIYGFSHTHLSGTGVSDYGDVLIMPMMGRNLDRKVYSSKFSHKNEKAHAGFYSVHLNDDNIDVELTTTTRVGFHKYTFNKSGTASIILDLNHRDKLLDGKINIINNRAIEGFRKSEAWAKDQRVYFRIEFSKEVQAIISMPSVPETGEPNLEIQSGAMLTFNVKKGETILVKVSISGVDVEGAKKNMQAELPGWDFEKTKQDCQALWNKELSKIEVRGGTKNQQTIFYTALYHCFIHPSIYNDVDGRYLGRDMKIHKTDGFNYYTVFSLWDTFRALHPLFNLVQRERNLDFIKTFLEQYKHAGRLPMWELSSNETDCMIGSHAVSVIADAYVKGIRGFDVSLAIEASERTVNYNHLGKPIYRQKGFLTCEDENESVSKTLEYSYNDWCLAQLMQTGGESSLKKISMYQKGAQSWKNMFDAGTGFMRPRKNGGWYKPFDAREVNNNYTEANAWQYSFFVPHDVYGLIDAMGGAEKFEKKLDELFETSSQTTGRQQADITGMIGQYAHGNEPSHHMAYLYSYVNKPEKTQQRVRQILNEQYKNAPDGLAGNEDCGQMSAWYVFSAMGFYPLCPGINKYVSTKPLFDEIKINGKPASGYDFTLPEREKINPAFSLVPAPIIETGSRTFTDSLQISIETKTPNSKIFYIVGDSFVSPYSTLKQLYTKPFFIKSSTLISAIVIDERGSFSSSATGYFHKIPHNYKIELLTEYNPQYTGGGKESVIDGLRGTTDWRKGNWQGYWGKDFECVIDLGEEKAISEISIGFLQDVSPWIMPPIVVEVYTSDDGKNFVLQKKEPVFFDEPDKKVQILRVEVELDKSIKSKFVKVKGLNFGKLPAWHESAGEPAWLFVDEVEVK